ncbi:MAG: hypothetical protein IPL65_12225 [Lewinellaceae bacterium]|nr:hypothetical protein [Lewinellaceae bacterium]
MENDKKNKPEEPESQEGAAEQKMPKIDIRVNAFGEIVKDYDIEQINRYLDEHTEDKKLKSD